MTERTPCKYCGGLARFGTDVCYKCEEKLTLIRQIKGIGRMIKGRAHGVCKYCGKELPQNRYMCAQCYDKLPVVKKLVQIGTMIKGDEAR